MGELEKGSAGEGMVGRGGDEVWSSGKCGGEGRMEKC